MNVGRAVASTTARRAVLTALALTLSAAGFLAAPQTSSAVTTVQAGTYENTSAAVTYAGAWGSSSSSQDSGGSVSTLAATGSASITFEETSVKVVARTANYYGIANVYVDDTLVGTLDQYSAATTYKAVVYTSPVLSRGVHTLRVERSGTKNDASSGRSINLDGFVVADSRPPAPPADLTAAAEGAGVRLTWSPGTEPDLAGYLVYRSDRPSGTFAPLTGSPTSDAGFTDPALTPAATYAYRVTAVDRSGNESARTSETTVTALDTAVGPGTVESTAEDLVYSGAWASSSSTLDSGGSVATLASSGWVQLGFRGTAVKLVARTASYYGIANVYVDDELVGTADLYSASTTYKAVVYSSPALAPGVHTVRVERSGTKNDASSGRTIDVDALVVVDDQPPATPTGLSARADGPGARLSWDANDETDLAGYVVERAAGASSTFVTQTDTPVTDVSWTDPALTPGTTYRYRVSAVDTSHNSSKATAVVSVTANDSAVGAGTTEDDDPAVVYSGAWTTSASGSDSGGSVATLAGTGWAQVAFNETSVKVLARTASYYGIVTVHLDGVQVATVDLYSPTSTNKTVVWSSPALAYRVHTLRVERTGTKNDASSGRSVNLDGFVVADSRAPAAPSGLSAEPEGNGARLRWTPGTEADLAGYLVRRATGTSDAWTSVTDEPVSASDFLDPALTPGTSYRYRVSAVDTSGNESDPTGDITLTARVAVAEAGTTESTSAAITYVGPWTTSASPSDSGGSSAQLAAPGYAQVAFRETSVKVVTRTASHLGIADVYLDGTPAGTIDQYSATAGFKSVVYTSPTLAYGTHTLRIVRSGTKNQASSGRTINLDSVVVPDSQAPGTPAGLTATAEGTGARLSWKAVDEPDLGGYLVYRANGPSDPFARITDEPVTGTDHLDRDLTPGTGYRYRVTAVDTSDNESEPTGDVPLRSAVGSGTYPASADAVVLGGSWAPDLDPATGVERGRTASAPATARLTFLETGVRWVGSTGPSGGVARVSVDGTPVATVDQYSPAPRAGVTLFSTAGLGAGSHTVEVAWTSGRNGSAAPGATSTSLEAFVVADTTPAAAPRSVWALPVDDGIDLEWNPSPDDDAVGYRVYRAKGDGAYALLTSTALDDAAHLDAGLAPGTRYRYQVTAVDAAGNESSRSSEASATTALSTGTVENTSPAVLYSTPWSISSSTRDSGGSYSVLGSAGDARLTFSGTGIKWVTRTNNFSGIGQVYVDGTAVAKVDLYSAVQQFQRVVWSTSSLPDGVHTIRIERTGTMNSASTGRNLTLDSFVVTDSTPPPAVPAPRLSNTRLGTTVAWNASSAADVAAWTLLRTGPDGAEVVVDRLPTDQLSFLDVGLAPSTTYRYRVVAVDTSGNQSPSVAPAAVTTPPLPAPTAGRYAGCPTATQTVSTSSTLRAALRSAGPGDVIVLAPGTYTGVFALSVAGTQAAPVWVCGPRDAVVDYKDPSSGTGFSLTGSSWVNLTGMTVRNVQKGVVVNGGSHVTVSDIHFTDIGEEAVHLRASTVDSTVVGNRIERTGVSVPQYGEGVYIGSDPLAWCTYSGCDPDRSDRNAVLDNVITQTTAEAVEAKAGTSDGTVRGNVVDGGQMTTTSSGGWIVIKGNAWLVADNTGTSVPENGFTATYSRAEGWGGGNVFVGNRATLGNALGYGVWVQRGISNIVGCDNTTTGGAGATNLPCQR